MPHCPQKLDYGNVYVIKMKSLVETFFFWGLETVFACKTNNTMGICYITIVFTFTEIRFLVYAQPRISLKIVEIILRSK